MAIFGRFKMNFLRILKDSRIVVRRAVCHRDRNPWLDSLSMDDRLLGNRPSKPPIRTEQPHKLLNGRRDPTQILSQLLL